MARADPDGYTLLYTTPGQQMTLPYLVKNMPYDPDELRPVSQVSLAPSVLVVNTKLGVKSLEELIALAKKRPGELNYVSAGIGASSHLNGELLQILAGIRLQHVPYKGTGEAVRDLVGGNGDLAIDTVGIYTGFIKDKRLIPLGVTTPNEVPLLPGVPPLSRTLPRLRRLAGELHLGAQGHAGRHRAAAGQGLAGHRRTRREGKDARTGHPGDLQHARGNGGAAAQGAGALARGHQPGRHRRK